MVRIHPLPPRRSKLYIACSDFFLQKIRVRSCRCSSFFAKSHARLAYSFVNALIYGSLSLPTFCDSAFGILFHMLFLSSSFNHTLSMLDQALYRLLRFFYTKNQSSLIPLLLLLRKKSRSRRLLICKRIRNAFGSLPTFCDSAFGTEFHMLSSSF